MGGVFPAANCQGAHDDSEDFFEAGIVEEFSVKLICFESFFFMELQASWPSVELEVSMFLRV